MKPLEVASALFMLVLLGGCGSQTWQERSMIANAKSAVREQLSDPSSAKFGDAVAFPSARLVCGTVNAKNAFGGYVGQTPYAVDTWNGQIHVADSKCDMSCFMENFVSGGREPLEGWCSIPSGGAEEHCKELYRKGGICSGDEYSAERYKSLSGSYPEVVQRCIAWVAKQIATCPATSPQ